jgi:type I restriction enzyme M protein
MGSVQQQLFPVEQVETQKHQHRKNHNQYFTPEFAAEKALSLIPSSKIENIIDPAVGNGVFLRIAAKKWEEAKLFGVDIDKEVIDKLKKSDFQNANFFYGNALLRETWQNSEIQDTISNGGFNLVVGNPPFSSWFGRIDSKETLSNFRLAYKDGGLTKSLGIEVLFLETFINLTKEGGFIIIVLPDGILSNPQCRYVRGFILRETKVLHIINLPRNVFKDTSAKTSILILQRQKTAGMEYLSEISDLGGTGEVNNAIKVRGENLMNRMDYFYYYNLQRSSLKELMNEGILCELLKDFVVYCKTGKSLYGKGRSFSGRGLRFLHATNITDVGINYRKDERFISPSSKMYFPNAHAKTGDIVFVRVGVGCAGRVAIVDAEEDEGIATDYIHIFRVKDINPYFLTLYLKTRFGKDSINLLKHGVGTVSINKTDLLSLPVPLVPESIQLEIEESYKNILTRYRKAPESRNIKEDMSSLIFYLEERVENLKEALCGNVSYAKGNLVKR